MFDLGDRVDYWLVVRFDERHNLFCGIDLLWFFLAVLCSTGFWCLFNDLQTLIVGLIFCFLLVRNVLKCCRCGGRHYWRFFSNSLLKSLVWFHYINSYATRLTIGDLLASNYLWKCKRRLLFTHLTVRRRFLIPIALWCRFLNFSWHKLHLRWIFKLSWPTLLIKFARFGGHLK